MKKAYILIDVLISIALIFILATALIPAISNALVSRQKLMKKAELYQMSKNQLEAITAASYMGKDDYEIVINKKLDYSIDSEQVSDNLKKYIVTIKDEKLGEIKFEKILQSKSLYSN